MTDTPTDTSVMLLLDSLGPTADAVAESLRAAGVRGERAKYCKCPLAVWLASRLGPTVESVRVDPRMVYLGAGATYDHRQLPAACREFVAGFDAGRYPGLDADQPATTGAVGGGPV